MTDTDLRKKLSDDGLTLAISLFDHIEQQARLAVTKSGLLVAANALLVKTYYEVLLDQKLREFSYWEIKECLFAVLGALILIAFLSSIIAIVPKSRSGSKNDLLFYAGIAKFRTANDYARGYFEQDKRSGRFEYQILENIHGKSLWLRRNFYFILCSIICSFVSILLGIVITVTNLIET